MTPTEIAEALAAERRQNRRIANRITALIVILVTVAALAVFLFYHPERAGARKCSAHGRPCMAQAAFYNHLDVCKSTLRGYSSDDDIHSWGVAIGAKSFGGWGGYGHYSDGSVWVWGLFNLSSGSTWSRGRCSGGDYASDWFQGW